MRITIAVYLIVFGMSACTFTRKVQTGMQAYEVKQFSVATQLFTKEYENSRSQQDRAILAYYAGESFSQMNDPASAAPWYFKAHQDGFGPEALERYAEALKKQEKYGEALKAYEDLLKSASGNAGYRSNVTLCRQAMEWQKNPNPAYKITSVPFNTASSEYSPVPIGPGKLIFTSDRDISESGKTYLWTGRGFSDLYVKTSNSDRVETYDPVINSEDNDGTPAFTPDQRTIVFTRCYVDDDYDAWCQLMLSERLGNEWSTPQPLPFVKSKINYGQPAFAANGTVLFFASDAEAGQGGHDLYFSQKDGNGVWSDPINLGAVINTMGNEQYPTVYKDTLFFSSDRLAGLGGLDIFKTYMNAAGQWMPPINLRSPINSGADDFGFVVDTFAPKRDNVLLQGYFTSSRGGAARQDDIYAFEVTGPKPEDIVTETPGDTTEEEQIDYQLFLSLRVMEPEFEVKDDPNSKRVGKKPLPNGPVVVTEGLSDQRFVTDELGQLILKLEWNKQYSFTARYRDHLAVTYDLNTADIEKDPKKPVKTISQTLELDPIFKNKEIVLENIFYDYDQWYIREDAKPSLDALSVILKNNPSIRIQLASHTDCRGTDEYNIELSQKRAQAAVDYLKSVGIPERRLMAQGFGETNPAVVCECEQCTEAQHQANRRTTFTIID
jgi:outer membrane protein OmpA-like peptidoglycan-associated protein